MKRTPLRRKTPLRARPRADRDVKPGKAIRRARRPAKPRPAEDPAYLERVRRLPCRAAHLGTPCRGSIEAHHAGRRPGVGRKAHDHTAISLCGQHHRAELHALAGAFRGWKKSRLRKWQDEQITVVQGICQPDFDEAEDRLAEAREWPMPNNQGSE